MPLSDYTDSVGGGLKLKGVKDGRVKKHKKKKPAADMLEDAGDKPSTSEHHDSHANEEIESAKATAASTDVARSANKYGKTEAQLQHEERRRKMEDDRARREGAKSHKEKVEELNKYLSKLSEHHDMPRIGPG
ncbi:hypothetical protein AMS68_002034 [Peltaster fructicola]|uniref:DUF1754-domain-containing protein n=1 Tax=Peltaster fructicola TaxID=286661 RepID=A0A6H0XP30_9PEZI|nr:hypothetical protein AMS68_002034 [Peltaster fructicola]